MLSGQGQGGTGSFLKIQRQKQHGTGRLQFFGALRASSMSCGGTQQCCRVEVERGNSATPHEGELAAHASPGCSREDDRSELLGKKIDGRLPTGNVLNGRGAAYEAPGLGGQRVGSRRLGWRVLSGRKASPPGE